MNIEEDVNTMADGAGFRIYSSDHRKELNRYSIVIERGKATIPEIVEQFTQNLPYNFKIQAVSLRLDKQASIVFSYKEF